MPDDNIPGFNGDGSMKLFSGTFRDAQLARYQEAIPAPYFEPIPKSAYAQPKVYMMGDLPPDAQALSAKLITAAKTEEEVNLAGALARATTKAGGAAKVGAKLGELGPVALAAMSAYDLLTMITGEGDPSLSSQPIGGGSDGFIGAVLETFNAAKNGDIRGALEGGYDAVRLGNNKIGGQFLPKDLFKSPIPGSPPLAGLFPSGTPVSVPGQVAQSPLLSQREKFDGAEQIIRSLGSETIKAFSKFSSFDEAMQYCLTVVQDDESR